MTTKIENLHDEFPLPGLGKRIKELRASKEESQTTAAKFLGVSDRAYKSYELERRVLPLSLAKRLAERHRISIQWLTTGEGHKFLPKEPEHTVMIVEATLNALGGKAKEISAETIAKYVGFVLRQTLKTGETAQEVATGIVKLVEG